MVIMYVLYGRINIGTRAISIENSSFHIYHHTPSLTLLSFHPSLSSLHRPIRLSLLAFWNRVRSRFGSIFYLRSHGDDEAIIATINTIDTCIRLKGCVDVPQGVDEEEGVFSFLK